MLINVNEILVQLYSVCPHRFVSVYFCYQRTASQSWTMPTSTKSYNPLEVTSKTTKLTKKKSPRLSEYVHIVFVHTAYFGVHRCSLFSLGLFVYESAHNNHTPHPPCLLFQAYRFHPDRVERMTGGPDSVLWDRWEWHRASSGNCPEGNTDWDAPKHLMPH